MLQAGSREEVRSQLPGDSDWEWSGCDLFSIEQSQSKANVGWEADRRIPPASSRAASLLSSGRAQGSVMLVVLEGEGRRSSKRRRLQRCSEILSPFQLSSFSFSPTVFIMLGFSEYISTPLETGKSLS